MRLGRGLIGLVMLGVALIAGGCGGNTDLSIKYWEANQAIAKVAELDADPEALALIDVRSSEDFAKERIPKARNLTIAEFATPSIRNAKAPGELVIEGKDNILIYANDPGSAVPRAMAKRLMRMGYDDVYVLQGGLLAWKRAGGAVEGGGGGR
jgi:rhodanese-related sulfurtransferase